MTPACSPEFDEYASNYDAALAAGIAISGESREYFARGRIALVAARLFSLSEQPHSVLDFGCGTGSAAPFILNLIRPEMLVGVDISSASLEVAIKTCPPERTRFVHLHAYQPAANMDLVYCSGVFHHIPVDDRISALDLIRRSLKPGGLFAFWENNPWHPGARYVMSRIPFDRHANPISASAARRLLKQNAFQILQTDYLFIFPRVLRWLRRIEPLLTRFPFGAQYQVLCRRPQSTQD